MCAQIDLPMYVNEFKNYPPELLITVWNNINYKKIPKGVNLIKFLYEKSNSRIGTEYDNFVLFMRPANQVSGILSRFPFPHL